MPNTNAAENRADADALFARCMERLQVLAATRPHYLVIVEAVLDKIIAKHAEERADRRR